MRKQEQEFYHEIVQPLFNATPKTGHRRVENKIGSGTPDIAWASSFTNHILKVNVKVWGWLELKVADKLSNDRMDLTHFTGQQRNWLKWGGDTGGNCSLFVKCDGWYFLIPADRAFDLPDKPSIKDVFNMSSRVWSASEGISHLSFMEGLLFGENQYARDGIPKTH